MKLKDAQALFAKLRQDKANVVVRRHAWADHSEREFTLLEVTRLTSEMRGVLKDNGAARAAKDSFVWHCKDALDRKCEITIVFEAGNSGELIIVISAFREVDGQ